MSDVRDFVRSRPKPTEEEALNFARSVMEKKDVGETWSPYSFADGLTIQAAKEALFQHAVDMSERMAYEMIVYALEEEVAA